MLNHAVCIAVHSCKTPAKAWHIAPTIWDLTSLPAQVSISLSGMSRKGPHLVAGAHEHNRSAYLGGPGGLP